MKTIINELAAQLPAAAQAIETELAATYAIKELRIDVSSGGYPFTLSGYGPTRNFVCGYGRTLEDAIRALSLQLTPKAEVAAKLRERAAEMLKEAEGAQ